MTTSEKSSLPTIGQLERRLSQKVQAFYREHLGQQPSKVTCQIFGTKVAFVLEDSVTKPEQVLVDEGKEDLAEQVRQDLDQVLQPQLKDLIQEIVEVEVVDLLSDSALDTKRGGIIAILAEEPQTRVPKKG